MRIENFGNLTLTDSHVTGNTAGYGGGIYNWGALRVERSAVTNNLTTSAPGGGGIDNRGTLTVVNSTVSGNRVTDTGGFEGGGIYSDSTGTVTITGSTITDNEADGELSVGGVFISKGRVTVRNTIIAANRNNATTPDVGVNIYEFNVAFGSQGYNLIGNPGNVAAFNQPGDQVGTAMMPLNPALGPLANNGGTTPTHHPLPGSPVIDKGKTFINAPDPQQPPATDQRGFPRLADIAAIANQTGGDGGDIGAVELTCSTINALVIGGGVTRPGQLAPVVVVVTGGTGSYTITLDNNGGTQSGAREFIFLPRPQSTTTYTVTAGTDSNGCPVTAFGSATITVDATPPTITCPGNQIGVIAGTSGPVIYPAPTVSDNRPGATFNCTHASGSSFPLGTTTVNCTARDAVGNTAACSFTVMMRQPRPAIKDLIARVRALAPSSLTTAQANGLIGHLELANTRLEQGQTSQACTHLQNFVTQVNAFISGGQLTAAQGQALVSYANKIRNAVGCPGNPFPI